MRPLTRTAHAVSPLPHMRGEVGASRGRRPRRPRRRRGRRAARHPHAGPRRAPAARRPHRPARHAGGLRRSSAARTALVFVNTRFQAEFVFQELWRLNDDGLPIALHHGSLDAEQRRKVEAAMARGRAARRWSAPRPSTSASTGATSTSSSNSARRRARSRMVQRIGRANHRLDEPVEGAASCRRTASRCWNARPRSTPSPRPRRTRPTPASARSTCWPSTSSAWPAPSRSTCSALYEEVRSAAPYRELPGRTSSRSSISSPPAATRCGPTSASPRSCSGPDGLWRVRDAADRRSSTG